MDQAWFEMQDIRNKNYSKSAWIPLRAIDRKAEGESGYEGYKTNFFGSGSVKPPIYVPC